MKVFVDLDEDVVKELDSRKARFLTRSGLIRFLVHDYVEKTRVDGARKPDSTQSEKGPIAPVKPKPVRTLRPRRTKGGRAMCRACKAENCGDCERVMHPGDRAWETRCECLVCGGAARVDEGGVKTPVPCDPCQSGAHGECVEGARWEGRGEPGAARCACQVCGGASRYVGVPARSEAQ